jgi:PD-(D/E)XK nuclease superfamily
MTIPPSEVDTIHERHLERARRIFSVWDDSEGSAEMALGAAFGAAADLLHEEADAATEAKKRGHQSLSKDLRNAAGRVMGIAQDLAELAKFEADTPKDDWPLPGEDTEVNAVQLHVPSGDVDGYDPSAADRLAALPTGTLTTDEASAQFFADRPAVGDVRAYLAGETDVLPDSATAGLDAADSKLVADVAAELRVFPEGITVPAPHLAFEDPLPIARQFMVEPFPGANEHRRTFADLARPVDPAGIPDHWSWSQLTSAEDCGVQHRLSRLERVPQQPQWANIGGTTFHTITEAFDRGAWQAGGADRLPEVHPELIKSRWEDAFTIEIGRVADATGIDMGPEGTNYRASKGGKENYTWWLIEGERMLAMYLATRRKLDRAAREAGTLAEPLELMAGTEPNPITGNGGYGYAPVIEWAYTRPVPGPTGVLNVHGVIDRAYRMVDGSIVIKDLKTGSGTSATGQLGEYAWALAHLLIGDHATAATSVQAPRIRGCFYDARKGIFSEPIDLLGRPNHPHEEYVYRYHTAQAARNAGVYMPRRSDYCNGCSVAHACPVGPKAASAS